VQQLYRVIADVRRQGTTVLSETERPLRSRSRTAEDILTCS
jgi:hypothetical protein